MAGNQNASELIVAAKGTLSVAPFGTALPTDSTTALNAAFVDVGYVTDAGVTLTATPTVTDIGAWQKLTPIRKIVTNRAFTAAAQLEQWNQETIALAFGGGTWTMVTAGAYKYSPPNDGDALTDYSVVIDAQDGTKSFRYVIFKANVTDAITTNLVNTAAATFPVTFSALTPDNQTNSWCFYSATLQFSLAS